MNQHDPHKTTEEAVVPAEAYEAPEIIDYGSLEELTRSGSQPLTDSWGGSGGS